MRFKGMKVWILLMAAVLVITGCVLYGQKVNTWKEQIPQGEKPVTNPMKGFAAWGENYRQDEWVSFAYVPVYWNLLEPEEDIYDFEALEERCCFKLWEKDQVRLILRVVLDSPSDEKHMDIPQWLYDKMNGAGDWYDCSYGKGFSPDYWNQIFQEAHKKLIRALADRYQDNPQIAFIQLGSLGHWGEWHVNTEAGIEQFPYQALTDQYVQDYLEYFDASRLLLRRPYEIGAKQGMGLYNDSFGDDDSHSLWLSWIADGYVSDQNQEELSGMPDFWKKAPSGGEFAADHDTKWYFRSGQIETTMKLLQQSHTTFLGPNAPKYEEYDGEEKEAAETLLREMGYCLGVRECTVRRSFFPKKIKAEMTWENTGIAPLYGDWPIYLELRDEAGETVWSRSFESNLSSWLPGEHEFSCELDGAEKLEKGVYRLYAGIVDLWIGTTAVKLDMESDTANFLYEINTIHL